MKIRNNKPLYYAVEHMLQGLSYWLGFRTECYSGHLVMEAVAVEIAVQILNAHIDHSLYKVKMEYGYGKILKNNSKERMDVAILDKSDNCVCGIEFKTSTDSNNGVAGDIAKLKTLPPTMHRLVVLISQKETNITKQFVDDEGKARRSIPNMPNVKVIRATKAMETAGNSKHSFKVICIEVLEKSNMKSFDQKPIEQHVQELDESIQNHLAVCVTPGITILETSDPEVMAKHLEKMVSSDYQVIGNEPEAEMLKKQQGRPVYRWDAKTFKKYDAIGSMYQLSKLPKEAKPIVIIENIADIPDGDRNIYDDPALVENILLHSWKNDTIHLTHHKNGPFQMNKWDYTVIFPVKPGDIEKLRYSIKGEVGVVKI